MSGSAASKGCAGAALDPAGLKPCATCATAAYLLVLFVCIADVHATIKVGPETITATGEGVSVSTHFFVNPGNAGIGTSLPGEKLEVSGNIKLSGASPTYKVTNLASPTASSDAATKGYVDASGKTPNIQTFTAGGTWVRPAGVNMVWVSLVGGGGGGNGGDISYGGGGGGGGQAFLRYPIAVSGNVTVTIGSGGAGGGASANGIAGASTSFGTFTALGGKNGTNVASPANAGGASGGGIASNGNGIGDGLGNSGGAGGSYSNPGGRSGAYSGGSGSNAGGGGASSFGKGGDGGVPSGASGSPGGGYGAGGGAGSYGSGSGAAGSSGYVIVEWWE